MVLISLIPFALVALGGWLVWWGLRRRHQRVTMPQGWLQVIGVVIDVGAGPAIPPRIEYRAPDGRRLRVPGPPTSDFAIGDEVLVLLDPLDPSRARLDVTEREAQLVVSMLVGTGAVLLVIGLVTGIALM